MAKLLKHFGLGYGNSNKKTEAFDFRAKTLPVRTNHRDSALADASKGSGRKNTSCRSHTVDCGDCGTDTSGPSSHSSRRASHETFLTIPARGLRARAERDWSLRGTKHKEARDSEPPGGAKGRFSSDSKDLRRSTTANEISCSTASAVTPAVCTVLLVLIIVSSVTALHATGQKNNCHGICNVIINS